MAITSATSIYPVFPVAVAPGTSPTASSDPGMTGGMRMAAPMLRTYQDVSAISQVFQEARPNYYSGRDALGKSSLANTSTSAIKGSIQSLPSAIGGSFVFSALISGVTTLVDLAKGQLTLHQAMGSFCADTAAYTAIGTVATLTGGFLASMFPAALIGTVVGFALGAGISFLLGHLYETKVRRSFSETMTQSIQGLMAPSVPTSTV